MAVEAYRVDDNVYPINPFYPTDKRWKIVDDRFGQQFREYAIWFILTTPVSYITSIPHDTFKREFNEQWKIWQDYYRGWNLENHRGLASGWGAPSTIHLANHGVIILMASVGPDQVEDCGNASEGQGMAREKGIVPYDPTNGTVSWGDIYYCLPGGSFDEAWTKSRP